MALRKVGVELTADGATRFNAQIDAAGKAVTAFGHSAEKAGGGLNVFGTIATGALLRVGVAATELAGQAARAIGRFVTDGIEAAGDLQQAVANISTIKPDIDTSAVFSSLNEMQTRVPQTADALGDSLYNIFSSIETTQEGALKLVEEFARSAVGAGTSAETFGTAALGVMNAYGLAVEDAAHISDVFFNTINLGVVSGEELAGSLGPVTQSARAAGVSLDELGALIAGVTKEGGPASQNINNLNNFLQKISTKDAQKQLNALGVATTDATGAFLPTTDVLTVLKERLAGMTEAGRASALQAIFPDAQARIGAQTLLSQLDFVKDAIDININSTGAAAAAYEKMSGTFKSQSALLKNSMMAVATTIGAGLMPILSTLISTHLMPAVDAAGRFAQAFFASGDKIGLLAGKINTILPGFSTFVTTIQSVVTAFQTWAPFTGTIGGIQAALGALGQSLPLLEPLTTWLSSALPVALQMASTLWTSVLQPAIATVVGFISSTVVPILQTFAATWIERFQVIASTVQSVLPTIQGVITTVFGMITGFLQEHGASIMATLMGAWTTVQTTINTVIQAVGSIVQTAFGVIAGFLAENGASIQSTLSTAWTTIQSVIQTAVQVVSSIVTTVFGVVASFLAENSGSIQAVLTTAWQTIQTVIQAAALIIQNIIIPIFTGIASFLADHTTEIKAILQTAWNLISTVVTTVLNVIQGVVRTVMALIKGDWSTAWTEIKATAETLWNGIKDVVDIAIKAVKGVIDAVLPTIESAMDTAWETIKTAASVAWELLRSTIETKIGEVVTLAQELPGKITGALAGLAGSLLQIGKDAIQGLIDGLKSIDIGSILGGIITGGIDAAKRLAGISSPSKLTRDVLGKPMGEGIVLGIEATGDGLKQAIGKSVVAASLATPDMIDAYRKTGKGIAAYLKDSTAQAIDAPASLKQILSGGVQAAVADAATVAETDVKQIFGGKLRAAIETVGENVKQVFGGKMKNAVTTAIAESATVAEADVKQVFGGKLRAAIEVVSENVKQVFGGKMRDAGKAGAQGLGSGFADEYANVKQFLGGKLRQTEDVETIAAEAGMRVGRAYVEGIAKEIGDGFPFGDAGLVFQPGPGGGGGGSTPPESPKGPKRARGGPVTAGAAYIVGERGRELFVPDVSGIIIPNNRITPPASPTQQAQQVMIQNMTTINNNWSPTYQNANRSPEQDFFMQRALAQ